jgi:hypothetical protein
LPGLDPIESATGFFIAAYLNSRAPESKGNLAYAPSFPASSNRLFTA